MQKGGKTWQRPSPSYLGVAIKYTRHKNPEPKNGVRGEERPTRPMIIESVCVAFMPFRSFGPACHDYIRNGAGFPNRRRKFQRILALILQDLFPLPSREAHVFRCYSAPSQCQNCAKVLETLEERCQSSLMGRFAKPF
jgi:hypothetical protein